MSAVQFELGATLFPNMEVVIELNAVSVATTGKWFSNSFLPLWSSNSKCISKSIGITKKLITFYVATFDEDFYRMILATSEKYNNNHCRIKLHHNFISVSTLYIPQYSLPSIWKGEKDVPVTNGTTVMDIRRLKNGCTWKTVYPIFEQKFDIWQRSWALRSRWIWNMSTVQFGLGGSPISKYGSCKWVKCSFENRLSVAVPYPAGNFEGYL